MDRLERCDWVKRTVAAVLLDAFAAIRNGATEGASPQERKRGAEALDWIESGREDHPLRYLCVCYFLDFVPSRGRVQARRLAAGVVEAAIPPHGGAIGGEADVDPEDTPTPERKVTDDELLDALKIFTTRIDRLEGRAPRCFGWMK